MVYCVGTALTLHTLANYASLSQRTGYAALKKPENIAHPPFVWNWVTANEDGYGKEGNYEKCDEKVHTI